MMLCSCSWVILPNALGLHNAGYSYSWLKLVFVVMLLMLMLMMMMTAVDNLNQFFVRCALRINSINNIIDNM